MEYWKPPAGTSHFARADPLHAATPRLYAVCSSCGNFEFAPIDSCSICWHDTLCLAADPVATHDPAHIAPSHFG